MTATLAPDLLHLPVREGAESRRTERSVISRLLVRPRLAAFLALTGAYFVVGTVITLRYGVVMGDALARVANANYAIASRDPHLSAIGFVWNPLPSLLAIPILTLRGFWPALATHGVAGVVVSAAFMAGSVVQVHGLAMDFNLRRGVRVAIVALFALHPMVVFYAGNGMSEAMFCFFLLFAARFLARWLVTGEVGDLVSVAFAFAGGYLARYEMVPPTVAASALVAVIAVARTRGTWWPRVRMAIAEVAVLATPFVAVFTLWALASWLIVGTPFEHFTSVYGNTLIKAAYDSGTTMRSPLNLVLEQLAVLEPLWPVLLLAAVALAAMRRDPRVVAGLAVFLPAVLFVAYNAYTGTMFGFLRYHFPIIPFTTFLAVCVAAGPIRRSGRRGVEEGTTGRSTRSRGQRVGGVLACIALAAAIPASILSWQSKEIAYQEQQLLAVFDSQVRTENPGILQQFETERQIAAYLDHLQLPDGSVLLDVQYGFPIVLASENPHQFVIPSDRDYETKLASPREHGVQYLLAIPRVGRGTTDGLNMSYSDLYDTGGGFAVLVGEFSNLVPTDPPWRLYRVEGIS